MTRAECSCPHCESRARFETRLDRLLTLIGALVERLDSAPTAFANGYPPETSADPEQQQFLTVAQFAKRLTRKNGTVYKWIRLGRLPHRAVTRGPNDVIRIDWKVYSQWIRLRS